MSSYKHDTSNLETAIKWQLCKLLLIMRNIFTFRPWDCLARTHSAATRPITALGIEIRIFIILFTPLSVIKLSAE